MPILYTSLLDAVAAESEHAGGLIKIISMSAGRPNRAIAARGVLLH